ncbi:MAG TPA: CDP-alcohol phosphatidyltransferase family protein [Tepidisphaeraceae bacterium]|jgi:CDP-diacylglycerol--glycerol-3-phosphate 3-phosphatidyltransferase/cardiolipin synthase|nr:CDP-alcohol phosphatidyltransferase family protein [Tepidisphaeraceae bacterium]
MPHRQVQLSTVPGLWPPSWPMGLTMLRLLLLPVFLWVMLSDANHPDHSNRWFAVAIFAIMAATDKLDGYLARRLNQTSKIGAILDPVADKLLIACSIILLSFSWVAPAGFEIPWYVVAAVYGKDVIVVVGTLVLLSIIGRVNIVARWLGKISTALQLALVIVTLVAPDLKHFHPSFAYGLTRFLWITVTVIAIASCIDYVLQGIKLLEASRQLTIETER